MSTATITSKSQITIPKDVRERLKLKTGDRLDFVFLTDDEVAMRPRRTPFESLRGVLQSTRSIAASPEEMDEGIRESVRARWERSR